MTETWDGPFAVTGPNGARLSLGFSVICVPGRRRLFVAPDLIWHYVTAHRYSPPRAFLDAVHRAPLPSEPEYLARLERSLPGFEPDWEFLDLD